MPGLFRPQNTGFAAQAFKTIILNPQRNFSLVPIRRCGGLLAVGSQSLQSRPVKPLFFTPVVQKAPIAEEILTGLVLIGAYSYVQVHAERTVVRKMLGKIEEDLRCFRREASDAELVSYMNNLISNLEPHYLRYGLSGKLKEHMMGRYDIKEGEVLWSRRKVEDVIMGLETTREIISDLNTFNDIFLEWMHLRTLWPRFDRAPSGFSLIGAVMPPAIKGK